MVLCWLFLQSEDEKLLALLGIEPTNLDLGFQVDRLKPQYSVIQIILIFIYHHFLNQFKYALQNCVH